MPTTTTKRTKAIDDLNRFHEWQDKRVAERTQRLLRESTAKALVAELPRAR